MNLPLGFTQDPRILHPMEELQPFYKGVPKTICRNDIMKNYENKKQILVNSSNIICFLFS